MNHRLARSVALSALSILAACGGDDPAGPGGASGGMAGAPMGSSGNGGASGGSGGVHNDASVDGAAGTGGGSAGSSGGGLVEGGDGMTGTGGDGEAGMSGGAAGMSGSAGGTGGSAGMAGGGGAAGVGGSAAGSGGSAGVSGGGGAAGMGGVDGAAGMGGIGGMAGAGGAGQGGTPVDGGDTGAGDAEAGVDPSCRTTAVVGVYSPVLQCQWPLPLVPPAVYPNHKQVLTAPLVANMPSRPTGATWANIVIVTSDSIAGAAPGDGTGGRIRILNGQTCAEEAIVNTGTMPAVRDAATPAIADLDNDGKLEIVARENYPNNTKIVAFRYVGNSYTVMWEATGAPSTNFSTWDGVSIHDLNDDGFPEVIARFGEVYDGRTGQQLSAGGGAVILESDPVLGDVDGDGTVELVANKVFSWNGSGWTEKWPGLNAGVRTQAVPYYAFADFGTRRPNGTFDPKTKDGRAEIVAVGPRLTADAVDETTGTVGIYTLEGEPLLQVSFPAGPICRTGQAMGERGGPPSIADFDGDGMPELGAASAYAYRVFDLDCADAGAGCQDASKFIRWAQPVQDCSSGATGSTAFDFEGDGPAEVVYGDECFARVYHGKTGEVLLSQARSSATWSEYNIVADTERAGRSRLIFSNATEAFVYTSCNAGIPDRTPAIASHSGYNGMVDKTDRGLRCATDADCPTPNCVSGFCRCTVHATGPADIDCGNDFNPPLSDPNAAESGYVCTTPLPGTPGTGNVCRMQHGYVTTKSAADKYFPGIRVFKDKFDRWAASRAIWNQHAYSITNVNDDGTVPRTSAWMQNFRDPKLDNFRANRQGATSADVADLTGRIQPDDACRIGADGSLILAGQLCNRGARDVAANLPVEFFLQGPDGGASFSICGPVLSSRPVPVGGCSTMTCSGPQTTVEPGSTLTMVVNGPLAGGTSRTVDECNYQNNTAADRITCRPL